MFTFLKKSKIAAVSAVCSMVLVTSVVYAQPNDVLNTPYQAVADVANNQAQVVFFRPAENASPESNINIYVDGEYQTSLIPGSYNVFCVKPGAHVLGSWLKDDPRYQGKQSQQDPVNLEGGKTYYFHSMESSDARPVMLQKNIAAEMLMSTKLQNILLSRASAVSPCQYLYKEYSLASDVLFDFGQYREENIKQGGREEVARIAKELNQNSQKVVIIGHTDPIGSATNNLTLGLNRAETIRSLLSEYGVNAASINATTVGSKESITAGCEGLAKQQKIACYAPERRVVIRTYPQ
jgi:OOP family OmpA-OmpF porin